MFKAIRDGRLTAEEAVERDPQRQSGILGLLLTLWVRTAQTSAGLCHESPCQQRSAGDPAVFSSMKDGLDDLGDFLGGCQWMCLFICAP